LGLFQGDALRARALRGSALTMLKFGGQNALRLGSNLILTRLLFPEAFGLMALVQVFLTGLQMFSDLGIHASVIRSARGEDPVSCRPPGPCRSARDHAVADPVMLAGPVAAFYEDTRCWQIFCRWWG
jgi:hypothetical protein